MKLELLTCEMLTWNKEKLQLIVHLCKLGSDFPIEIWHEFIFIWNHSEGIEPLFAHGISLKKSLDHVYMHKTITIWSWIWSYFISVKHKM